LSYSYNLQGDYKGFIEVIEWDQLIDDAEKRNKAFCDAAGLGKALPKIDK
jgi:hypothetical protein